jgi:hypothetical protein
MVFADAFKITTTKQRIKFTVLHNFFNLYYEVNKYYFTLIKISSLVKLNAVL